LDGILYFNPFQTGTGYELWRSDGTAAGTWMVKDINPGPTTTTPGPFTVADDTLYFPATTPDAGDELWRSDGTESGTYLLKDLRPGTASGSPGTLTNVNGRLFFSADDGVHGRQPWASDGTTAATGMLKPIADYSINSSATLSGGAALGDTYLFAANDNRTGGIGSGYELWRSDGTPQGTTLVKDINPGTASGVATAPLITAVGDRAYFVGVPSGAGQTVYKTDGTQEGTVSVKAVPGPSAVRQLAAAGGRLYFATDQALWSSDGSEAGTQVVATPPAPIGAPASPRQLTAVDDRLFFFASNGADGVDLWVSGGEASSTTRLVGALPNGLNVLQAAAVEDFLFFITVDFVEPSYHKTQLWMSDGTLGGTRMIFDTPGWDPAAGLKSLATLTPVGDRLFFQAPTVVNQNGYNDGLELFAVQVPEPAGFTVVGIVAAIMGRRRHCGDASRASRRGGLLE
jgi:ELWxxDGT repeat protein